MNDEMPLVVIVIGVIAFIVAISGSFKKPKKTHAKQGKQALL
jgi:hypothetical protein